MHKLIAGLVTAGLLTSHVASAACVSQADREALDVAGLKSQLMVQTLTCKNDNEYNAFINKFKPELNADEKTASNYFSRTYGRNGQRRQDEYLTLLANSRADISQKDGSRFCAHNEDLFRQVLALNNGSELKEFAAGRTTGQPPGMAACEGGAAATATPTRASAHSKSPAHKTKK